MKKTILLGVLMLMAAVGVAKETRQDVSFSGTGLFGPTIHGPALVVASSTGALGLLTSHRHMPTPHSALEVNYSFIQNNQRYIVGNAVQIPDPLAGAGDHGRVYLQHDVQAVQPVCGGWRWHVDLHSGPGQWDDRAGHESTKGLAGLFGGGLAYERSPASTFAPSTGAFW